MKTKEEIAKQKIINRARFLPLPVFSILPFLAKHWQAIALIGLIGGIIIYHQYRTHTINSLRADLTLCEAEREDIAQALDKQNKRIEELVKKGRLEAAKFNELKARIESSQHTIDERINLILAEPKPQTCQGAIKYLISVKRELAWPE